MKNLIIQLNIPFCYKRCSYCSQTICKYTPEVMRAYVDAMIRDLESASEEMKDYTVSAVSVEGGSPVLAEPSGLQRLLRVLRKQYHTSEDIQISLQTMPGDYSRALMQKMPDCGVNHWIFGLQTADMKEHTVLDRPYRYETQSMIDVALRTFDVHEKSFELLYGIPGQTLHSWKHTIEAALFYAPEHITIRPLRTEKGTAFEKSILSGAQKERTISEKAEFYRFAKELLIQCGYQPYTISDFAKNEAVNRYRMAQLLGTDQLGIGYLSESCLEGVSYRNGHSLQEYLEHSDDLSVTADRMQRLRPEDLMQREFQSSLIRETGVDLQLLAEKYGKDLTERLLTFCDSQMQEENMKLTDGKWYLTDSGIVRI